jgi:quercetin dioxygenase-like cupin family protein
VRAQRSDDWSATVDTSDGLVVIGPDEGKRYGHLVQLVEAKETGGRWGAGIVQGRRGGGGGEWTHVHRGEVEGLLILEGEVELCGAETVTRIGPGTFVLVPADVEHSLRVVSETARWFAVWPAALDGLQEKLAQAAREGRGEPEVAARLRAEHGMETGRRLR